MTENEIVGWHHQLNGDEFEQALRIGDGQGSLVCYTPWCCKESDTTELLSNSKWKPKLWRTMQINRGVGMNHVFMLSCQSCPTLCNPLGLQLSRPLSMGFSKQEYWSGCPFPPAGDHPNPELSMRLLHWQVDSLPLSHLESPIKPKGRQVNLVSIQEAVNLCFFQIVFLNIYKEKEKEFASFQKQS